MFQSFLHAAGRGGTSGPGPGPDLVLEAVNGSALQVTNTVGSTARQAWHGFGWGLGVPTVDARTVINNNIPELFDQLGTTVMRFNSPHDAAQTTIGKPTVDIGVAHGVDTVLATGYLWRVQNGGEPTYSATIMANEIDALMDAGMLITHATVQNEPDGHVDNAPTPGDPDSVIPLLVASNNELRNRLNTLGRSAVKIYGIEWAHNSGIGQYSEQEYDALNAAGLVPSVVAFGGGHNYHDCPTNTQYDSRWLTKTSGGLPVSGIISSETGNMDTTAAGEPHWGARCIAAMNHGSIMEVAHIGPSTSTDNSQTLVNSAGTPSGAQLQARVIFGAQPNGDITIPRGSRFRLVTCNDRPSGLNTTFADRLIRNNGDRFPRLNSACCERPDGRWTFVCCNTTIDSDDFNPFLGAHYGAQTIQVTVTIPDLVAEPDRTWSARRCSRNGVLSSQTVNQHDGQIRFTLAPGETIGMISSAGTVGAAQTWSDGTRWTDSTGWVD